MKITLRTRYISSLAAALGLALAVIPTANAEELQPDKFEPCPMSLIHSSSALENSPLSEDAVPVSASNTSMSLIGYVQQGDRVTGDPGMKIKITRSTGTTFSIGVSASATAEAGVLFAQASATAGITVTNSWVTNRTEEGSWVIPNNGRRGWISIGSDKYRVTGTVRYATPSCHFYNRTISRDAISAAASFKRGQF